MVSREAAGGEGRLDIEATAGGGQVENLPGEVKPGGNFALHGFRIDLPEGHPPYRDHGLVPVAGVGNREVKIAEELIQSVALGA